MVYKVIVDFEVEQGVLYLRLFSISPQPVFKVKIEFEPGFTGLSGKRNIHEMRIFQGIPFFAPGKKFRILIDKFPVYLNRNEPTHFRSSVSYVDEFDKLNEYDLEHDLDIYRDLGEMEY